jgi:plastocyanin
MNRFLGTLCSIVACGLVAAGCGSSNDNSSNDNSSTKTQKPAPAAPAAPAAPKKAGNTAAVSMKNIQFSPKALTVAKGTTVKWTNDDSVAHDVTKKSGPGPDFSSGSGNLAQGATYQQTLNTPGTIKYVCTVHPGMAGTITVK